MTRPSSTPHEVAVTFGGHPCLEPSRYGVGANHFATRLGPAPGTGLVVMAYGNLRRLDLEASHELVFTAGPDRVALQSIIPVRAYCLTPAEADAADAAFAVELADRRHLAAAGGVLNVSFNVLDGDGVGYLSASLSGGITAWTWDTMLAALWAANGLMGAWPGLPFGPDGAPEGWTFWGVQSYRAINDVLARLGCALRLDPIADAWSVVRLAADDEALDTELSRRHFPERIWDVYPVEPARPRVPTTLRVHFPVVRAVADTTGAAPWYALDRTDPTSGGAIAGVEAGTVAPAFDDMSAVYDASNVLINAVALATRASERAADYFRQIREKRLWRRFSGGMSAILPGSRLKGVVWSDRGGGLVTEAARHPGLGTPDGSLTADDGGPGAPGASPFPTGNGAGGGFRVAPAGGGGSDVTRWTPSRPGAAGGVGMPGAGGGGGGTDGGGPAVPPSQVAALWPLLLPLVRQWVGLLAGPTMKYESYFRTVGSSLWYLGGEPHGYYPSSGTLASTLGNRLYALPFLAPRGGTLDRIMVRCTTAFAGGLARAGVYTNLSDTNPQPDALVVDSGDLDCSTTGEKSAVIAAALSANTLYWLVATTNNAASVSVRGVAAEACWPIFGHQINAGAGGISVAWDVARVFGALPDPFTGGGSAIVSMAGAIAPAICIRYSA